MHAFCIKETYMTYDLDRMFEVVLGRRTSSILAIDEQNQLNKRVATGMNLTLIANDNLRELTQESAGLSYCTMNRPLSHHA